MKTDWSPKRFKKYQDKDDTQRTSRSRVATPDWSIDLKRMVRGNGSFTTRKSVFLCKVADYTVRKAF